MSDIELRDEPTVREQKEEFIAVPGTEEVAGGAAGEVGEVEPGKRLFVRPINFDTSMEDVEKLFTTVGPVKEISLKPGYGFIEYETVADADGAIEKLNKDSSLGYEINIERAMARGSRREKFEERPPKPTALHRVEVVGATDMFSWQDLKDLARTKGVEAVFTKVDRDTGFGLIDVASDGDRDNLLELKGADWKGATIDAKLDPRGPPPAPPRREGGRFGDRRGGRGGFGGRGRFGDRRGGFGGRGGRFGDRPRFDRDRNFDRGDRYDRGDRFERRDRGRGDHRRGGYERDRSRSPRRDEPSW